MKKFNNIKQDLTKGSIVKALAKLSIPIIFANLLQTAYQLIDTFWVGRLGKEALAAVSISFPLIYLMIAFGGGFAMAGTILVSQYKGKKDHKALSHVTAQTFLVGITLSLVISIVGYLISPFIIHLMGAEPSVFTNAVSYIKISFIGTIFMFIFMIFQSLMRGVGDVKTPVIIVFSTVLLNLILDPLFIFGYGIIPALGVSGAAMATVFTEALAAVIAMIFMYTGHSEIRFKIKEARPDFKVIKKIFKLGIPSSIDQSARATGVWLLTFLIATFGTVTIAAFGIGIRIWSFIAMPGRGLYMATSAVVGQNIGAGKIDRAIKTGKLSGMIGFISLSILGALVFIFADSLAAAFIPGETETIKMATTFLRLMSPAYCLMGLQMGLNGALNGAGNTKLLMVFSIISIWVLRLPFAFFLSKFTSLSQTGIWLAFPLTNIIAASITVYFFTQTAWYKKKVI